MPHPNFRHAIIIRISDHEARQGEKEIHGQETMPNKILIYIGDNPFHKMEDNNSKGRDTP